MVIDKRSEVVLAGSADGAAALAAVEAWARGAGFSVTRPAPGRIELRRGSQTKLRLLGGAFIAPTSLPVVASVTVRDGGGVADVVVADDVRIGSRLFMRQKYELLVAGIVTDLGGVLGA